MARFMRLALGVMALGFACEPAMAQKWHTLNQARKSALVIECNRTKKVSLTIEVPSNSGWKADVPVSARVGSKTFALEIDGGADYVILSDTREIGISPELMAALQTAGSFVLEGPAVRGATAAGRTYSLASAGPHLARIAQACGMAATATQADSVLTATPARQAGAGNPPPEVAKARASIREECGGRANFKPGFQKTADFSRDGKPDYILDYTEIECVGGGMSNPFCGSAGCTLDIFVSEGNGYRHGYGSNAQGWSIAEAAGRSVLVLELHGSACGRIGAQGCSRRLTWNGREFAGPRGR